jgi:hypothetical protein
MLVCMLQGFLTTAYTVPVWPERLLPTYPSAVLALTVIYNNVDHRLTMVCCLLQALVR